MNQSEIVKKIITPVKDYENKKIDEQKLLSEIWRYMSYQEPHDVGDFYK